MTDQEPLRFPPLSEAVASNKIWDMLKLFGPGAIIASVTIGSGETLFASRGGAIFGYGFLWCFVLLLLMKGIQVYTAMRYFTLTGEHPMERWATLPGPYGLFPAIVGLLTIVCFPFFLSSLPIMLGSLVVWIFTGNPNQPLAVHFLGTCFIILAIMLTFIQSYKHLEIAQTAIVALLLFSILAAMVAVRPDWLAVLIGAIVPHPPHYEPWVIAKYQELAQRSPWVEIGVYMGAIGGGVQDYVGYVGMLREKMWGLIGQRDNNRLVKGEKVSLAEDEENVTIGKRWLRAPLIDSSASFVSVMIFAAAFMILGVVILRPQQIIPGKFDLLNHQAQFLTHLHPSLLYLYQIGIFLAFFGTVYGAYELYTRTTYEAVTALSPKRRAIPLERLRKWVLSYTGLVGIGLVWWAYSTGRDPIQLITFPVILTGVFLAGPWCFAMIYTDRTYLPKRFQMGIGLTILNIISGIAFTGFGLKGMWDAIR